MSTSLPYESTTQHVTQYEVDHNKSIQAFIDTLTSEQQRRFGEIAHHLLHMGFEEGSRRYYDSFSDQQKNAQLIYEAQFFIAGAAEYRDMTRNLGNNS